MLKRIRGNPPSISTTTESMVSYKELQKKIEAMERRHDTHGQHFQVVFKAIKEMLNPPEKPKGKIRF